jgi:hypothetical protein
VFETGVSCLVEFTQDVKPSRYRLFQVADLICTLHLLELKLRAGLPFSKSEHHFFGGAKKFRRAGVYFLKLGQIVLLLSITYS